MNTKRVRVRMPSTSGDYYTAGDVVGFDGETVTLANIAGFPDSVTMGLPVDRVTSKRSGRRGRRRRGVAK